MTDEEKAAVMNAKAGWQDGLGLFPEFSPKGFDPTDGARITRAVLDANPVRKFGDEAVTNPQTPPFCNFGDLQLTLSGVAVCGSCILIAVNAGGATSRYATINSITGVNVMNTLSPVGGPSWQFTGGNINYSVSNDPACPSYFDTEDTGVIFTITCDESSRTLSVNVSADFAYAAFGGVSAGTVTIGMFTATGMAIGTSQANSISCGAGSLFGGGNGTITA